MHEDEEDNNGDHIKDDSLYEMAFTLTRAGEFRSYDAGLWLLKISESQQGTVNLITGVFCSEE